MGLALYALLPYPEAGSAFPSSLLKACNSNTYTSNSSRCALTQSIATLWTLLTSGPHGKPSAARPLILCPSSLVSNWAAELRRWLGDRVAPVAVEDTRAEKVREAAWQLAVLGSPAVAPVTSLASCGRAWTEAYCGRRLRVPVGCRSEVGAVF